ncbi:MAG: hypothetical protein HYU99_04050 [Deltaproteobacteria bacterium]|nr:hypothetical protein [Deltaproteobacteria bacterium]
MNPIDDKSYFNTVMGSDFEPICTPTETGELSEAEFLITANEILKDGYKAGQDVDYVSGRLHDLIQSNPELVKKNNLPTDQPTIKTKIVEPYYAEENGKKFNITGTVLVGPFSLDTEGNARLHIIPQVGVCATVRQGIESDTVDKDAVEMTFPFGGGIVNYGPKFKQEDGFKRSFDKEVSFCLAMPMIADLSVPLKKVDPKVKEEQNSFNLQEGFDERIAKYRGAKPEKSKTVEQMKEEQNTFSFYEGFSERIEKYRKK